MLQEIPNRFNLHQWNLQKLLCRVASNRMTRMMSRWDTADSDESCCRMKRCASAMARAKPVTSSVSTGSWWMESGWKGQKWWVLGTPNPSHHPRIPRRCIWQVFQSLQLQHGITWQEACYSSTVRWLQMNFIGIWLQTPSNHFWRGIPSIIFNSVCWNLMSTTGAHDEQSLRIKMLAEATSFQQRNPDSSTAGNKMNQQKQNNIWPGV